MRVRQWRRSHSRGSGVSAGRCDHGCPDAWLLRTEGDARQKRGLKDYYIQEMTRRGFFTSFGVAPSYAHADTDLDQAVGAWREVFPLLRAARRSGDWDARIVANSVDAFRRQVG